MSASENFWKYFLEKWKKYETFLNLKFNFFQSVLEILNIIIGFWTKVKEIWWFPVLYLGEQDTTCKCIKLEKRGPKSTHPTVYTWIINTLYRYKVV